MVAFGTLGGGSGSQWCPCQWMDGRLADWMAGWWVVSPRGGGDLSLSKLTMESAFLCGPITINCMGARSCGMQPDWYVWARGAVGGRRCAGCSVCEGRQKQ